MSQRVSRLDFSTSSGFAIGVVLAILLKYQYGVIVFLVAPLGVHLIRVVMVRWIMSSTRRTSTLFPVFTCDVSGPAGWAAAVEDLPLVVEFAPYRGGEPVESRGGGEYLDDVRPPLDLPVPPLQREVRERGDSCGGVPQHDLDLREL